MNGHMPEYFVVGDRSNLAPFGTSLKETGRTIRFGGDECAILQSDVSDSFFVRTPAVGDFDVPTLYKLSPNMGC